MTGVRGKCVQRPVPAVPASVPADRRHCGSPGGGGTSPPHQVFILASEGETFELFPKT